MARLHMFLKAVGLFASLRGCASTPSPQSLGSGLTILMDNDLQGSDSPKVNSAVVLFDSATSYADAVAGCEALNEALWSPDDATASIQPNLDYLVYEGKAAEDSLFWVAAAANGTRAISATGEVQSVDNASSLTLPGLCTNLAPLANASNVDTSTQWQVSVHSNNEDLVGFRDRTSFRFYGVRFAPEPERFTYSALYTGNGSTTSALSFGSPCAQSPSIGSEDCLFLNIWTPYLPNSNASSNATQDSSNLKPVMFWIHGGGFASGTGSDTTFDGGSLASRGDVVVVTINYRLSTLGFLALDDGVTNGNYGIADQITALDWVLAHIADFGGDASRITIFGQSAGGASVRALMASPQAEGKFAGAIPQSSVGGLDGAKPYSEYYTIPEAVDAAGDAVLAAANCTNATTSQVDCLRALDTFALLNAGAIAAYVVVDGTYITSNHLSLNGSQAPYSLLMGTTRDDAGALILYPDTDNETAYLDEIGWDGPAPPADLFPIPADEANGTLALYNMTARLTTDAMFRCIDEATVYSGLAHGVWPHVYYYEFERTYQLANWPQYSVCQPPVDAAHPYGDPAQEYFKCHSGELYEVFGTIRFNGQPWRDDGDDVVFAQVAVDMWAAFARTYDPNPDAGFLAARGFANTSAVWETAGPWVPATKGNLTLRALTVEPYQDGFREAAQCEAIGVSFTYWEEL